jgi:nucleotide-binding universal stress UspA family protein
VVLLNVIETPGMLLDFFSSSDELVKIINLAKDKLTEFAAPLQEKWPDVKFSTRVERGKPYSKILEVAEKEPVRLIVLGENHDNNEISAELGTTVYHITLKSPVPVLTIKGNPSKINSKIVLPLDLTRNIEKQLKATVLYGSNYDAEVHLVSALIGGIKVRESRIFKKLKEAEKVLKENNIKTKVKLFEVSKVPPFMRILQYSEEVGADMIIVLTHQEGYTYDNYIGAFAHHIINLSKIPVLSLTATAVNVYFENYFKMLVDPFDLTKK